MSGYSLAPFILRRPWLANMVMPAANWYANAAGYKKLGLRYATHPQHIPTPDSQQARTFWPPKSRSRTTDMSQQQIGASKRTAFRTNGLQWATADRQIAAASTRT